MRKVVDVLALVLTISLSLGATANAGVEWCEDDPIVTVDGRQFQMVTGFPSASLESLLGPVTYIVEVPSNVTVTVAYPPSLGPSQVSIVRTPAVWSGDPSETLRVRVTVQVAATTSFGFATRIFGPALKEPFSVSGTSNEPQRFGVNLRSQP